MMALVRQIPPWRAVPMTFTRKMKIPVLLLAFCVTLSVASTAQNYTAEKFSDHGVDIVRLTDSADGVKVAIAPSVGNRLYEMKVHGKNVLSSADRALIAAVVLVEYAIAFFRSPIMRTPGSSSKRRRIVSLLNPHNSPGSAGV
jgi:hypothetical protein